MNAILLGIIVVLVVVIIVLLILMGRKTEKLKKAAEATGEKPKGCCVGCTSCHAYTAKAEEIMDQEDRSIPTVVEGTLVDMRCYSQDVRNYTDNHYTPDNKRIPKCGTFCAKAGIPVGVLVGGKPGGKTFVLLTEAPKLADYVGRTVRINGRIMKDSGGLYTIDISVKENGSYKPIEIRTPM